jgi:DNA repair protein RadD
MGGLTLRPYQQKLENDIKAAFISGKKAVLAVLPTGGGKTVIFTHIAVGAEKKGNRVGVLTHRARLIRQSHKTFSNFDILAGRISPKFTADYTRAIQIASIQTLVNRLEKLPFVFKVIIVDEAHHATAASWAKTIKYYQEKGAIVLGVTATPCRSDGRGLGVNAGGIFDCMVLGPTANELISMGYLVPPRIFAPPNKLDLSAVKTTAGDWNKKGLAEATDKPSITGDAVEHYRKIAHKIPAVAFCVNVQHAKNVAEAFRANGYRSEAVYGGMDERDQERILNGLADGSMDVVPSCDLIGEGTDVPEIGCVILLRSTQSLGLYIQQVGRALRPSEGKANAIVLDHVGNVIAHGLPHQDREWSLDGDIRKKKKKQDTKVQLKQCPTCFAVHEPLPICPACGHAYTTKGRELREEDGELQELTAEQLEAVKIKKRIERKAEEAQAQTLDELRELGKKRGYKDNWAIHRYNARQSKR